MSQGMVPCMVEGRRCSKSVLGAAGTSGELKTKGYNLVTVTVWWPHDGVQIPTALVTSGSEVLVPLMNLSNESIKIGVEKVIAILDEADC